MPELQSDACDRCGTFVIFRRRFLTKLVCANCHDTLVQSARFYSPRIVWFAGVTAGSCVAALLMGLNRLRQGDLPAARRLWFGTAALLIAVILVRESRVSAWLPGLTWSLLNPGMTALLTLGFNEEWKKLEVRRAPVIPVVILSLAVGAYTSGLLRFGVRS